MAFKDLKGKKKQKGSEPFVPPKKSKSNPKKSGFLSLG